MWIQAPSKVPDCFRFDGAHIYHQRAGGSDAARGLTALREGKHRITYQIKRSGSGVRAYGMVLGLADADAPIWSEPLELPGAGGDEKGGKKDKGGAKKDKKDKKDKGGGAEEVPKHLPSRPSVAWGVCPGSGKFLQTHDVRVGHMGGAYLNYEVNENSGTPHKVVEGTVVVFEIDLSSGQSEETSAVVKRDFQHGLHPLAARRLYPKHLEPMMQRDIGRMIGSPVATKATMAYTIDGGPMVQTGVSLPPAVYPWILLSYEGDAVTLLKVESIDEDS